MISSAELLSNFEHCQRWGYYSQHWRKHRMSSLEMFNTAVRQALIEDRPDPGENAGEIMMTMARDRGLELTDSINTYRCAINHAAAADLVVTAIREKNQEVWRSLPNKVNGWWASGMMDPSGNFLRRFIAVSSWNEDREFYEKHSWYVLGDVAHYMMPMQLVVAVMGSMQSGRRHGYWSKGLLHPHWNQVRFKLRRRSRVEGFVDSWQTCFREDHDEISREKWLQGMIEDEVLQQSLFVIKIPVPEETALDKIRSLATRQLERLRALSDLPEKQLTTCHNPLAPCPFRACCWSEPESKPEDSGYDPV
jgi:hypothetical protein